MKYTRNQHEKFLDEELQAISDKYIATIKKPAISLLENSEVFVSQFIKIDEQGNAILKMRNSRGLPRKGDYFCAVLLIGEMAKFKNWGDTSWYKLRKEYQKDFSEVYCAWHGKADSEDFSMVGIKGMSMEMMPNLKPGCIITLGPQEPPIDYYLNLIEIVKSEQENSEVGKMLDYDEKKIIWNPQKLNSNKSSADFFSGQWNLSDEIIIQGPPGTGKTYKMAELIALLLHNNKSVLVTALTNRALMELASKDALKPFLDKSVIAKTKLTSDESKELPKLQNIKSSELFCQEGNLTLATFYMSSKWAKDIVLRKPYDYVIMDEASQALYAMICASKKLGKKVVWIGDQCQLPPVINMSVDRMIEKDYVPLSNGFNTLCENFTYPSYQLTDTYRLSKRAAHFTSFFYNGNLNSVAEKRIYLDLPFINKNGGPSLYDIKMTKGKRIPNEAISAIMKSIEQILKINSKTEIAVLSKFKKTVKSMQKEFVTRFGEKNNIIIDTVERVQGLTCDICFFLIPNDLCYMSLEKNFFNVATSRAKYNTVIVCDIDYLKGLTNKSSEVSKYLENIENDNVATSKNTQDNGDSEKLILGIKQVGYVDLSQFETPKQKAVKSQTKENIYIIDTNVFVNCPDIISKIDEKYMVVLSAKVIDELDRLKIKLSNEDKRNVESALRYINKALDKPNVKMELSDLSLLPSDFDKRSPDNNILTVALKFKDKNPILLTSDNGLQVKAKGLKMKTISLKDFLKR